MEKDAKIVSTQLNAVFVSLDTDFLEITNAENVWILDANAVQSIIFNAMSVKMDLYWSILFAIHVKFKTAANVMQISQYVLNAWIHMD